MMGVPQIMVAKLITIYYKPPSTEKSTSDLQIMMPPWRANYGQDRSNVCWFTTPSNCFAVSYDIP